MSVSLDPSPFYRRQLALDTANTVVLRGDPAQSFDRFDDAAEMPALPRRRAISAVPSSAGGG